MNDALSHAAPPRFLFVTLNRSCNLRCQHCEFWLRNDADKNHYVTGARMSALLGEFAVLNPRGAVVICGGEPMLELESYFHVTRNCRELGLKSVSVINGTRIRSPLMADRMIVEGPDEISVSLNSHRAALHDETRGVPGAFDKAVQALRLLLTARTANPARRTRIYVMGLIFDQNYRDIEAFYDFVLNDLGADKLKLNFLQPSFGQTGESDRFFEGHCRIDGDELTRIITRCDRKYGLGLTPLWLRQVGMYFRSLTEANDLRRGWGSAARTAEHICNSYDRNIMVNEYGFARLCFSSAFPGVQLKVQGDLSRFWREAEVTRKAMRQCNRLCGISHSVRRQRSSLAAMRAEAQELASWGVGDSLAG